MATRIGASCWLRLKTTVASSGVSMLAIEVKLERAGSAGFLVEQALEGRLDVGRGHGFAGRELLGRIDVEGQGKAVIRELPGFGDGRHDIELGIEHDQRLVDEFEQAERRERRLLVRIEARGVLRPGHAQFGSLKRSDKGDGRQRGRKSETGKDLLRDGRVHQFLPLGLRHVPSVRRDGARSPHHRHRHAGRWEPIT